MRWTLGPFHPALPGPFRLELELDGDIISHAKVYTGLSHRNMLGVLKRLTWTQGVVVVDRLDPDASIFSEWVYCLAVERLAGFDVPPRAQAVRVLLSELVRVSAHLKQLSTVAFAAGAETVFHFLLRERELILDLLELGTGSRHMPAFLRIGGVREDISEGFLERLQEVCAKVLLRIVEYDDLLTRNQAFIQRVLGRAVLSSELIKKHAISGVPGRIFSDTNGARAERIFKWAPHSKRPLVVVEPLGIAGDLHHRFSLKLKEVGESAELLQELAVSLPRGPYRLDKEVITVRAGETGAQVDSPRGQLSVFIRSEGGRGPEEVRFTAPSEGLIRALPEVLKGAPVEDLSLWLASLDIQIGEVDQ